MLVLLGILDLDPHLPTDVIIGGVDGQLNFLSGRGFHFEVLYVGLGVQFYVHIDGALQSAKEGGHFVLYYSCLTIHDISILFNN